MLEAAIIKMLTSNLFLELLEKELVVLVNHNTHLGITADTVSNAISLVKTIVASPSPTQPVLPLP